MATRLCFFAASSTTVWNKLEQRQLCNAGNNEKELYGEYAPCTEELFDYWKDMGDEARLEAERSLRQKHPYLHMVSRRHVLPPQGRRRTPHWFLVMSYYAFPWDMDTPLAFLEKPGDWLVWETDFTSIAHMHRRRTPVCVTYHAPDGEIQYLNATWKATEDGYAVLTPENKRSSSFWPKGTPQRRIDLRTALPCE